MKFNRIISISSLFALIGYVTSGPLGFLLVQVIKPQPPWTSPATFVEHYHIIQDVPFYFGFLLIGGMLMLAVGHFLNYDGKNYKKKFRLLVTVALSIVFFVLVSFNYICQTTFVRHLALSYNADYDSTIAAFSMANPLSFCWANEIWGYGFLGIANWLMAAYYSKKNKLIQRLLVINGIVSVAAVILSIASATWVMTLAGLVAYFTWNVLMIVLMILIYNYTKKLS